MIMTYFKKAKNIQLIYLKIINRQSLNNITYNSLRYTLNKL